MVHGGNRLRHESCYVFLATAICLARILCKYYETFIYSWINWFAIINVQIDRNAKLIGM